MKTTAEEKLLRSLENAVDKASTKLTTKEFKRASLGVHKIAVDVIAKHKRMIELWTAMDKRMQRRAAKYLRLERTK